MVSVMELIYMEQLSDIVVTRIAELSTKWSDIGYWTINFDRITNWEML